MSKEKDINKLDDSSLDEVSGGKSDLQDKRNKLMKLLDPEKLRLMRNVSKYGVIPSDKLPGTLKPLYGIKTPNKTAKVMVTEESEDDK